MTQYELEDRRLMISYFEAKIFSADLLRLIPAETVFTGTLILKGNQRQIRFSWVWILFSKMDASYYALT